MGGSLGASRNCRKWGDAVAKSSISGENSNWPDSLTRAFKEHPMNLNLLLAIIWLVLGAGIIIYDMLNPDQPLFRQKNWLGFSPGWILLVLVVWNLVRWWGAREAAKTRRAEDELEMERERRRYSTVKLDHEEPPNPSFDFTKPATKEPEGGETGIQPPS
jgi:hypothetical protein